MPILKKIPLKSFSKVALLDALSITSGGHDFEPHLDAGVAWLIRAHDKSNQEGVSYGYSLKGGWRPPYVETTGYIAVTFFNLAVERDDPHLRNRAINMINWLCRAQNTDGSFSNMRYSKEGIVFDSGQDLFGLVRAAKETLEDRFLDAAKRCGNWLANVADAEGRWTKCTHRNIPHVYNTRVAWALSLLNKMDPNERWESVARANLDWAVSNQLESGLFTECAFERGIAPYTHTIAYAIRGLWESGEVLDDDRYRKSAVTAANAMLNHVRNDGFIPGQITPEGEPAAKYCCLTGNAQMAIIWGKLYIATDDLRYRSAAVKAIQYIMATQNIRTDDLNIFGAIKGSHPVWGHYAPLTFPNWATKFFVDALTVCREWM